MFSCESITGGLHKIWRIIRSSAIGFWEDDCYTKASTLTFYTLQSIVPFLAAVLAIAKGFGFDAYLETLLTTTFAEQKEIFDYAIQIALTMLKVISSGEIVGIGVILLLWTNINLVGYIELALNDIWRIKISRSFFAKIKDFIFAVVVLPLILVASSSATVFVKTQIYSNTYFASLGQFLFRETNFVLAWVLSCFLFGALYFLIPNTKMRIMPRLIATILAGTTFQIWQMIFITLQVNIFSYNVVYGAFALLPLFLIWLQFSWIIALAGAEISARIENDKLYACNQAGSKYTTINQCELALLILYECLSSFYSGRSPMSLARLSERLKLPQNIIQDILMIFERNDVLVTFANKNDETCYQPLYDPCRLKMLTICDLIEHRQEKNVMVENSDILTKIRHSLQTIHQAADASSANAALCDLLRDNTKI